MKVFAALYHYNAYLVERMGTFPEGMPKTFESLSQWIDSDHAPARLGLARELFLLPEVTSAFQTIWNCDELQRRWAIEQGYEYISREDLLFRQILHYKPDVIWFASFPVKTGFIRSLRDRLPWKPLIVSWDGTRSHSLREQEGADIVLSCLKDSIDFYRAHDIHAEYLPFSFDERIIHCLKRRPIQRKVIFTGSVSIAQNGHNDRLLLLDQLCSLSLFQPHLSLHSLRNWRVWAGIVRHARFVQVPSILRILLRNQPPIYGLEMFQLLSEMAITVNSHIDAAGSFAGNIRLFEATGVGTCLVTDAKANLRELFEVGTEVISYSSGTECIEQCRWLLDHPSEARVIALAGQRRTLRDYSARVVASRLLSIFNSSL